MSELSPPRLFVAAGVLVIAAQLISAAWGDLQQIQLVYLFALAWHTAVAAICFALLLFASIEHDAA
jgi:hypothetical protein